MAQLSEDGKIVPETLAERQYLKKVATDIDGRRMTPEELAIFHYNAFEFGVGMLEQSKLRVEDLYPEGYFEEE